MSDELRENFVRLHRRTTKLTQSDLGGLVGVSRQSIVSIEKGNYSPSVYLALRLARALGTDVEALFPLPAPADVPDDVPTDRGAVK
ncbi:MAG: helix-turn-helix transcriptional regulator [Tomitella sp.]|nr:helix-turn-helix transcriptional regulator [Tomitella sp.]